MAECKQCGQEMQDAVACISVPFRGGDPVPYTQERRWAETNTDIAALPEKCHDCWTPTNGVHHPGCDVEECPACHWQAISCMCEASQLEEEEER
jgi:hypothetical protein